ncbi:GcrA cell cycle regulator [Saccharibacter sp. 17.LH.SD]|uniref:GcrA family cell cycle regulator n=1 Tax=Saccharibacter sp. 17.LH.SD TaxID=2689393 RepID=UPI00136F2F4A|nr:GcrA family cell cycle regulator [Saccharibacter sp. 17.LH.SD]MXV43803.1 GcrA cell cycle regulator [Saccharibacter sp. 17.LH.SD]
MEWTEELIAKLRELWSQGLSTAEIGRQLSITKNAVVGKAHRLELPPRPSPIRNKGATSEGGATTARSRTSKTTRRKKNAESELPFEDAKERRVPAASDGASSAGDVKESAKKVSESVAVEKVSSREKKAQPERNILSEDVVARDVSKEESPPVRSSAPQPRKVVPPRRVREAMDRPTRQGPSCQWPIGDPGTPDFHFCGATPLPGKPYCGEHAAIAYVKIRDRRH